MISLSKVLQVVGKARRATVQRGYEDGKPALCLCEIDGRNEESNFNASNSRNF